MNIKDKLQAYAWIQAGCSWYEVDNIQPIGLVGNVRFTSDAKRLFFLLWAWSAPRFSGRAGILQDRAYQTGGIAAVNRRIARCNRIIERIKLEGPR